MKQHEGREVHSRERDGRAARAVVIERTYETSVEDLWDALTDAERIPRWFLPVEGDLRLGGHYQLKGNASGRVTDCEPPTGLGLTWEFGGAVSWVDVRLAEEPGGGARLRLEHVALVDDSEHWERFGPGAVGIGWDLGLSGLGEHLRTGADVAAAAGAGDGPGPDVMAASSEGWCAADIASGTPEADARARAARTLAFYTGAEPES
jgi:uncharacterized protein YndB with AHSA1/START domain